MSNETKSLHEAMGAAWIELGRPAPEVEEPVVIPAEPAPVTYAAPAAYAPAPPEAAPTADEGLGIIYGDNLPVRVQPRPPAIPPERPSESTEWWHNKNVRRAGVAALLVAIAAAGAIENSSSDDARTTTAGAHHGRHHHKAHHGKIAAPEQTQPSVAPSVTAAPRIDHHDTSPYVLTDPSPIAPSESDTPAPPIPGNPNVADGPVSLKIATFNFHGSIHTPARGPRSGPNRAVDQAGLIKEKGFAIVTTQELERNQRTSLMKALGKHFGIFPKKAQYGVNNPKVNSVNSIIWDKRQVHFKSGKGLRMPFYFHGWRYRIPFVKFRPVGSHEVFGVADTHDPAHHPWAKLRWIDAKQHYRDARKIMRKMPFLFGGDWNSGDKQRHFGGNITWGHVSKNLAREIMTRGGHMVDGYRAALRKHKTDRQPGPGTVDHIFASKDIKVEDFGIIRHGTQSDHNVVYIVAKLFAKHHKGKH